MAKTKNQLQALRNARKNTMVDLAQYVVGFLSGVPLVPQNVLNELSKRIETTIIANENLAQAEREAYEERLSQLEEDVAQLQDNMSEVRWRA